jgi:hypothetical protein
MITREPGAVKAACPVREGTEKDLSLRHLVGGLLHSVGARR